MTAPDPDITRLVTRWSSGDEAAFAELVDVAYPHLRALARRQLRRSGADATISTTVLVHEAYVKLAGVRDHEWPDRARFFAFCAKAMRHILIDTARRHAASKRGGGRVRVDLLPDMAAVEGQSLDLLALDEALQRLGERSSRMADIVECRFFAGMSVDETADALETSVRTVEREWTRARAYLRRALDASVSSIPVEGGG